MNHQISFKGASYRVVYDHQHLSVLSLKDGGQGFSPATFIRKYKKIKPREIPSCLISHLVVEILMAVQAHVEAKLQHM